MAVIEGTMDLFRNLKLYLRLTCCFPVRVIGKLRRINSQFFALEHHLIVVVDYSQIFL